MNAETLMKRILEYSTSTNHCCAFVGECIYTNKCLVDGTIVGCSQRYEFKKIKEALEAQEKRKEE